MNSNAALVLLGIIVIASFFVVLIIFSPVFAGGLIAGSMIGSLMSRYGVNVIIGAVEILEEEKRRKEVP